MDKDFQELCEVSPAKGKPSFVCALACSKSAYLVLTTNETTSVRFFLSPDKSRRISSTMVIPFQVPTGRHGTNESPKQLPFYTVANPYKHIISEVH